MIDRWEKFTVSISQWLNWVGGIGLVAMLGIIIADIIGIRFFRWPIPGAIEMVGFISMVVVAFAMTHTLLIRGHIQVEFFVRHLPPRGQAATTAITSLLGLGLFALLAWQSYEYGRLLHITGEVSMTQRIPFYPFVYALAFCCIPVCLALLIDFLKAMMKVVTK